VAALDKEKFFFMPVTELVAPGYFNIIKEPMSFSAMIEKVQAGKYLTWRSLVSDLDLICANAMTFNPKRSRVYKCAQQLQKAGKKAFAQSELEGRKAIALAHPEGPAAAEAGEDLARAEYERQVEEERLRARAALPKFPELLRKVRASRFNHFAPLAASAELLMEARDHDDCQLSDFSDTDPEDEGEAGGEPVERGEDGAPRALDLESLAGPAVSAVAWGAGRRPWRAGPGAGPGVPRSELGPAPAERRGDQSGRDPRWKRTRRYVEWRCRWLELRMRELEERRACYREVAEREGSGDGPRAAKRARREEAPAGTAGGGGGAPAPAAGGASAREFLSHPLLTRRHDAPRPEPAGGGPVAESSVASRIHMALQSLGIHVANLKERLRVRFNRQLRGSVTCNLLTPGERKMPPALPALLAATPAGAAPTPGAADSRSALAAGRKRRGNPHFSIDEVVASTSMTPKFVERVRVNDIVTPSVRQVTAADLARREKAWGPAGGGRGKKGRASGANTAQGTSPSSDEDTDDEAYASRHARLEEHEKSQYLTFLQNQVGPGRDRNAPGGGAAPGALPGRGARGARGALRGRGGVVGARGRGRGRHPAAVVRDDKGRIINSAPQRGAAGPGGGFASPAKGRGGTPAVGTPTLDVRDDDMGLGAAAGGGSMGINNDDLLMGLGGGMMGGGLSGVREMDMDFGGGGLLEGGMGGGMGGGGVGGPSLDDLVRPDGRDDNGDSLM